jgi:hypothetical protein
VTKEMQDAKDHLVGIILVRKNTWFTLGCCFMQLQQFQRAIPAFG